ncbi:hypothetical protein C2R22_24065 (plasmid) [Salinigranum rubrum]|uniref:Uncharacterized protein n=1 Tax=Salinigranum rubrum TaxID=755307 RepID=A0A2I8VRS8_9EURY|nr:AAA domain-containing protein [Salinigranum rubrum]AUV84612.1 hypothetical protein C2R22_24065 [Salinigranum rubrum]
MASVPLRPPAEIPDDVAAKPSVAPSRLGRFVNLDGCPQWFQYVFDDKYRNERSAEHDYVEAFRPLNILLAKDGNDFEDDVVDALREHANVRDHDDIGEWADSRGMLLDAFDAAFDAGDDRTPVAVTQARLGNHLEAWPVTGDADVLACWRLPPDDDDNQTDRVGLRFRVLDVKAAHEEKTYQQIQVACYTLLLRQFLEHVGVDYPYVIEGGIILRTDEFDDAAPDTLPSFDLEHRELDVRRLLEAGGPLDKLFGEAPGDVRYQLDGKCFGCAYKEACFTESIESGSTALLGLSRNDQAVLADHGIDTVEDLARLAYPEPDAEPYDYDDLEPAMAHRETYRALLDEPGISERLQRHIQEAQSFMGQFAPGTTFAAGGTNPVWLSGSGNGHLPEDDPPFEMELPFERGSMIRVYLNVQRDHRYDRVNAVGGYVSVSNVDHPVTFGHLAAAVPDTVADATNLEADVLGDALGSLFDAIDALGAAMETDDAPVHFYLYTNSEYEALVEALTRHGDVDGAPALRDLLGQRATISGRGDDAFDHDEQAMVSIVQRELRERRALGVPTAGLLPALRVCGGGEDALYRRNWTYTRSTGEEIDLQRAFRFKLFDHLVRARRDPPGLAMYADDDRDMMYPSRPRDRGEVPLEYVWAAYDVLTPDWAEEVQEASGIVQPVDPFRWVDEDEQETRIAPEDVEALVARFAHAVAHIERSITRRNYRLPKRPLRLGDLRAFTLGESHTARAADEFLALEYRSGRHDQLRTYGLPMRQRVQNGDAIPMVVTDAWVDEDDGTLHVDGHLPYDSDLFEDGDRVARACRLKGTSGSTMGSWVVANRLDGNGDPLDSTDPRNIEHGPALTVEELDIEARSIHLTAFPGGSGQTEFQTWHRAWTVDPKEAADTNAVLFAEREVFVLDKQTDDLVAQRSYNLLREARHNPLAGLLDDLADGRVVSPTTDTVSEAALADYVDWAVPDGDGGAERWTADPPPNQGQRRFIGEHRARLALLQGPPGTGKTSGALAHATLARVRSFAADGAGCTGVVAGESNKAVDEVLEDVHDALVAYRNQGDEAHDTGCDDLLDGLELVRLTSDVPEDDLAHVTYLDYHEHDDELRRIVERVRTETDDLTLVFATPARLYKLVDSFSADTSPAEWLAGGASFFDLLAVDEASMMRLPSFLTVGAYLRDDAQILVAGDQRQMSPVRQHGWDDEYRRTIQERVPYLSALDYCRLLRGDDVDDVGDDHCVVRGTAEFPLYQLERSYRCHEDVAAFLAEHVYAQDGIPYYSEEDATVRQPAAVSDGVARVLCDPDVLDASGDEPHALTLIIHDEAASRQSNAVEAAIGASVAEASHADDAVGIVTPHNAQRGLLDTYLDDVECDTVERYQGGQRPVILVSATASDPDFVKVESEFLLNPNRLNVAMSRMQRGLIVVASTQVFDVIPPHVEEYERAGLWKGLFADLGVLDRDPAWAGTLDEFVGPTDLGGLDPALDTDLEVYTLTQDHP